MAHSNFVNLTASQCASIYAAMAIYDRLFCTMAETVKCGTPKQTGDDTVTIELLLSGDIPMEASVKLKKTYSGSWAPYKQESTYAIDGEKPCCFGMNAQDEFSFERRTGGETVTEVIPNL